MHRCASCVCCKLSHFNDFSSQAKNHRDEREKLWNEEKKTPTKRTEFKLRLNWAELNRT